MLNTVMTEVDEGLYGMPTRDAGIRVALQIMGTRRMQRTRGRPPYSCLVHFEWNRSFKKRGERVGERGEMVDRIKH